MSIIGHKERALIRRGYHIKEALQRRSLDEHVDLRRTIINEEGEQLSLGLDFEDESKIFTDTEPENNILKIKQYKANSIKKNKSKREITFWTSLEKFVTNLPKSQQIKTFSNLNTLYNFLKPIRKDNKTYFYTIVMSLLEHRNPYESLNLIVEYIKNPVEIDKKGVIKSIPKEDVLIKLKSLRDKIGSIKIEELDDFLKKIRSVEYSIYEKSFEGPNFERVGGWLELKTSERFLDILRKIKENLILEDLPNISYKDGSGYTIEGVIQSILLSIASMNPEDFMNKADLRVTNDLIAYNSETETDEVVVKKGELIEVKKMGHEKDSYFSEFFAIYKNKFEGDNDKIIKGIYEHIINGLFTELDGPKGEEMLNYVKNGIAGIMFDNNRLILSKDIELYWSTTGARDCKKEPRLTIRFRVKNPDAIIYSYDKSTHSNKLEVVKGYITKVPTKKELCQ